MRAEIKMMHQRTNKTVCYVTHDQVEAMTLGDRIAVMKDGVVQQLAPPQEIYDNPANIYVAGFIGAPPMNFIPGKLEQVDGGLAMSLDTGAGKQLLRLPFSPGSVKARPNETVILGVRPERIGVAGAQLLGSKISMRVDLVEPTGPDTLVYGSINGKRILCRIPPTMAPSTGETIALDFSLANALLFNPETGARLDAGNSSMK